MQKNIKYAYCPDQDILCQVCWPKIKLLHPKNMCLTSWYFFNNYLFEWDYCANAKELQEAKENPIQLHYVNPLGGVYQKPWKDPFCPKAELWYYYLAQTPFFQEQMAKITVIKKKKKGIFGKLQQYKRKIFKRSHK